MIFTSFSAGSRIVSPAMRCPYCQSAIYASAPECPACRLSFPKAAALLGAVPRLSPTMADTTHALRPAEIMRLKHRISAIEKRFPQLVLQVVMHCFPAEHPLSLHVFWLFNAVQFAGTSRRGEDNHSLLLAIDPGRCEAALVPGYGLEPLLSDEALDHLLELAAPCWEDGQWAEGIMRVLTGIDAWLETIAQPLEKSAAADGNY